MTTTKQFKLKTITLTKSSMYGSLDTHFVRPVLRSCLCEISIPFWSNDDDDDDDDEFRGEERMEIRTIVDQLKKFLFVCFKLRTILKTTKSTNYKTTSLKMKKNHSSLNENRKLELTILNQNRINLNLDWYKLQTSKNNAF